MDETSDISPAQAAALVENNLVRGDITESRGDAVVNGANSSLADGGGLDGAIRHTGGPDILQACKEIAIDTVRVDPA